MKSNLFEKVYNPDVLTCLANLSNDEVFTSPNIVNEMLDLLPKELFKSKETKFLDPVCKTGVFLRETTKRLIKGLENEIPNLEERIEHILKNQIYGIAVTELTSLLSRRSVYCSKYPNSDFSVVKFDNCEGNIKYKKMNHIWNNDTCIYCNASRKQYDRDEIQENYAYNFLHVERIEELFNMKFDVIFGNPPYQLSDGGGTGDSAKPIYHIFIEKAIKLNPRYITMIVPSRWMKGGKGLDLFREEMLNDTRIKYIFDFENAKECFPGINIDGGVNYFLWEADYNGKCEYHFKSMNGTENISKRYLKTKNLSVVIRDFNQIPIIEKSYDFNEERFSTIVSKRNPFGFDSGLFNNPEKFPEARLSELCEKSKVRIYGVKGKKGGAKRIVGYIDRNSVKKACNDIDKYKLFFSKAYTTTATVPPEIIKGNPGEICTETFLEIGTFDSENEMLNCLKYMMTKFFRALLFYNRHSLNISQESFNLIPIQDFTKVWTDEELYNKYKLSKEEIDYIEKNIQEMDGE